MYRAYGAVRGVKFGLGPNRVLTQNPRPSVNKRQAAQLVPIIGRCLLFWRIRRRRIGRRRSSRSSRQWRPLARGARSQAQFVQRHRIDFPRGVQSMLVLILSHRIHSRIVPLPGRRSLIGAVFLQRG